MTREDDDDDDDDDDDNNNNNEEEEEKKKKKKKQRMWNLKCTIIPVIIRATGIVTRLKEKFGSCTGKTLDRFITKDSYTWNITRNRESTAV